MQYGFLLFCAALALTGCAGQQKTPDLNALYKDIASSDDPYRTPVVVIPGLLGSQLVDLDSNRVVWGEFGQGQIDPETPEGAALLSLPMLPDRKLSQLKDNVVNGGTADQIIYKIFGISLIFDAYTNILNALGVGGYRDRERGNAGLIDYGDEHFTCFQFDYDWRRDIVESAHELHESLQLLRDLVQKELADRYDIVDHPVRFNIVAHSMGGLVARYYLRYGTADLPEDGSLPDLTWAGSDMIENLVVVGTPNAGAAEAFQDLLHGSEVDPALPVYPPAVVGTMPSAYQLMPRPRHARVLYQDKKPVSLYNADVWINNRWGLMDPAQEEVLSWILPNIKDHQERREIAIDHLRKSLARAKQLHEALDAPGSPPEQTKLFLIAGDAQETIEALQFDQSNKLTVLEYGPGDGTVSRSSALMDERRSPNILSRPQNPRLQSPIDWDRVLFLFSDHIELTKDPAFTDNLLYFLLESPRKKNLEKSENPNS